MGSYYQIGPTIGVARLGNSETDFYLEPDTIGGLPRACEPNGDLKNPPESVRHFKDSSGRVKRQGAYFRIYQIYDDGTSQEITLHSPGVQSIEWTVHLANKKACWYNFSGLQGNLLYGQSNSYVQKEVPLRNATVTDMDKRRDLIIDPGPRTVSGSHQHKPIDKPSSSDYAFKSWPETAAYGDLIVSLGDIMTDEAGRLIVLGGFGRSGGDTSITSFAGADTWHDDTSDGPVSCVIIIKNPLHEAPVRIELNAWCIVGSPKFAPEVVNIVTLDDTMYDTAIRCLETNKDIFNNGQFNPAFQPNFKRDILPILQRPGGYRWVANTPSMNSLSPPPFDPTDKSDQTASLRVAYLELFRIPSPQDSIGAAANDLFTHGFPAMPLNSGSNSVFNQPELIDKFLTLTETQYFFLSQWSKGLFDTGEPKQTDIVTALTQASMGNCVGGPFCPGIEVTWSTRNPHIYAGNSVIRHRHQSDYYNTHGLNPIEDETQVHLAPHAPAGCEPGDLTKRMAIPWQADFFQCSVQYINFTNPNVNKGDGIPMPPTYYGYWWPPQSPWQVITGDLTQTGQALAGTPAGFQVMFTRGINTFSQMIDYWHYMGFLVNQNKGKHADLFPYIVEQERNHAAFVAAAVAVAVGDASNVVSGADQNFANSWFLPAPIPQHNLGAGEKVKKKRSGEAVRFATARQRGRQDS